MQVPGPTRPGAAMPRPTHLVVSFQYRQDVDHFQRQVRERFAKFGLELAEEKTRRILFGRFADLTCQRHGLGRPETFEFLGFKHVCGVDRKGRFALIRIPSAKSCRKFLARTREWIFQHRHWRKWEQQEHLTKMLRDGLNAAYFRQGHLGSPVRENRTPGSAWGDENKRPCLLGEASARKRLRPQGSAQAKVVKTRLYQPLGSLGGSMAKEAGAR